MALYRRTILRCLAALPLSGLRSWAQTAGFPGEQSQTLATLANVVLPAELGAARIAGVVQSFEKWVREYRAGAEMDHGYGFTRLRAKAASPVVTYLRQLATLQPALAANDSDARRAAVVAAIEEAHITDLPRTPDGRHVAADLMAFYFRGSDANDLCYRAAIGRDQCRGLAGSENAPKELSR